MNLNRLTQSTLLLLVAIVLVSAAQAQADDCEEARRWYHEGLSLSDHSEREASYYRKAIKLCPEFFEAHNKLGEVYTSWGDYELAIQAFKQAIRNPSFVEPHNNLGRVYRMQGRYDLARKAFTEALKMRPDFREAHNELKYVEKRLGMYDATMEEPPPRIQLIPILVFSRIPGMTLPKGAFLTDFQYEYWSQTARLQEAGTGRPPSLGPDRVKARIRAWIWGIRYGVTNNLTVGLIPKFFSREAEIGQITTLLGATYDPGLRVTGMGDTVFLTKYHLWGRRQTHLSAYHLLSIPTGDDDAEARDGPVLRRIPLGSGSFDFSPGLAFTSVLDPLTFHANLWYWFGERQAGDEFHFDIGLALPRLNDFVPTIELNYRWADSTKRKQLIQSQLGRPPGTGPPQNRFEIESEEVTLLEEGGHTLFVSPGIQYFITKSLKAEIGMQVPVIRPGDGWYEEVVFHVGLMKYFF
jgi:tetratricopeptide (TPR) repeat protein